jgi:hypothetical protein
MNYQLVNRVIQGCATAFLTIFLGMAIILCGLMLYDAVVYVPSNAAQYTPYSVTYYPVGGNPIVFPRVYELSSTNCGTSFVSGNKKVQLQGNVQIIKLK